MVPSYRFLKSRWLIWLSVYLTLIEILFVLGDKHLKRRNAPEVFKNRPLFPPPDFTNLKRFFKDEDIYLWWLQATNQLLSATKYVVDFGANDGHGPTEKLFENGYPGLLVEGDSSWKSALEKLYPSQSVVKATSYIYPHSAMQLLRNTSTPMNPYFFKIDIDADDCATIFSVLDQGFQPRVVQMEFTYDIPYPWSFAILPLSNHSYSSHYGFQSCSSSFATTMMASFGYHLIAVGGTKDALFCHNSSMQHIKELDAKKASYAFGRHAIRSYGANPTNTRQFEVEDRVPSSIAPSRWYTVDSSKLTKRIIDPVIDAACQARAKGSQFTSTSCPFPYVLSDSPSQALAEFAKVVRQP